MEGSRQYFGCTFSPWEVYADGQELTGNQAAGHHERNPNSKICGKVWENSF